MPRACRHKGVRLFLALLLIITSGCRAEPVDSITLGEWITLLDQNAGIREFLSPSPYFINVTPESPYFDSVQSAVEWEVLDTGTPFNPDAVLTREWAAYTLMNLAEREVKGSTAVTIRDRSASMFPDHISAAVAAGLFSLDRHDRFLPKKELPKEEAIACLMKVIENINHRPITGNVVEYELNEEIEEATEPYESIDEEAGIAYYGKTAEITPGQYVYSDSNDHSPVLYEITEVEQTEEGQNAVLEPAQAEDVFSSINSVESFEIDFTDALIIDELDGTVLQEGAFSSNETPSLMASVSSLSKTTTVHGYQVSYSITAKGVNASVSKTTAKGLKVLGELSVHNVKPGFRWKTSGTTVEDGYFRVDFTTSENLSASASYSNRKVSDFSKLPSSEFLSAVKNFFQEPEDTVELTLPLVHMEVPVPGSPVLTIGMSLNLNLYASGRAELSFSQENCVGMDIRNGKVREISDSNMSAQASLRASASVMGGVQMAMKLAGMPLADIVAEAGAKATVDSTVHLYDSEGNHNVVSTSLPADLLDECSDGNEDVLVCADIKAYKSADIKLNSKSTAAGRLGCSKTIVLADEHNGSLIPGLSTHMENGHFVDRCTRKDRLKGKKGESAVNGEALRISSYSMILSPGESKVIELTGLPPGISSKDLICQSDQPEVATVNGVTVTGHNEGSAIVTIRTTDDSYRISCTILVRQKQ